MVARMDWTDLPPELLQLIAERLGLIELLSFRGVCKDWNSASSTASAEIEALPNHEPWLLLYGENNSQCTLVTESFRTYSITIPELVGTTCIGSSHGWLLVFREGKGEGSMFFFCPFSRAKIDLPVPEQFSLTLISDVVATFSSPPTSQDCVACFCRKSNERKFQVYVIHRGATAWTKHELEVEASPNKILGGAYHNGAFFFFDNTKMFLCFLIENRRLFTDEMRPGKGPEVVSLRFFYDAVMNNMKDRLQLGFNEGFPHFICGTTVLCDRIQVMIPYYRWNGEEPGRHNLKGVCFQPRFHQIEQNQTW